MRVTLTLWNMPRPLVGLSGLRSPRVSGPGVRGERLEATETGDWAGLTSLEPLCSGLRLAEIVLRSLLKYCLLRLVPPGFLLDLGQE